MAGAGLMAVVVYDLSLVAASGSGKLARIVVLLILGALLLVTGYLSPLPRHRSDEEPTA